MRWMTLDVDVMTMWRTAWTSFCRILLFSIFKNFLVIWHLRINGSSERNDWNWIFLLFCSVKIVIHMKQPKSNSRYNNLSKLHQLNLIKLHLVFNNESHVSGDALYTQHATRALANAFGIDLNRFWFCVILSNGTPESERDSVKSIYVGVHS